jgi:hypothetical protein
MHVVGSTIMYKHLGGSSYEITLRLYRDCSPGNVVLPNSVTIQVRDVNGNLFSPDRSVNIQLDSTLPVPSYLSACIPNPGLCYEQGFYTTIVNNLPSAPGGYHLYYQYCCRSTSLNNVVNPLSTGMSIYAFIPEQNLVGSNSSPVWNLDPPLFECQGNPMNYDYGATDADGDSLVFTYYTPYTDPAPTFPSGVATFTPITWVAGFGANNSCGGPNLTMSSQNGFITGAPPNIGMFQHGMKCEEYRNGVKIAEINRDYPFVVVTCPPTPLSAFFAPAVICLGTTAQFQNNSLNATTYHWDFGVLTQTNDTSNVANPSWLYTSPGVYTVTLVANPYTACADTSTQVITVSQVHAAFSVNDTLYVGNLSQFTDSSWTSNNSSIVMWTWDFGDGSPTSSQQNPTHIYAIDSTYTVTLIVISADGCTDTITMNVFVDLSNSIFENSISPIGIMPNPSDGTFTISLPGENENGLLRITDLAGRIIFQEDCGNKKLLELKLNVSPGIYFVEYSSAQNKSVQKILIK